MIEVRFHGRGGQGAVTSAELVAHAAISEGKYAQSFPSFGPERRGAPVQSFTRVSDRPIRLRTAIREPDFSISQRRIPSSRRSSLSRNLGTAVSRAISLAPSRTPGPSGTTNTGAMCEASGEEMPD